MSAGTVGALGIFAVVAGVAVGVLMATPNNETVKLTCTATVAVAAIVAALIAVLM